MNALAETWRHKQAGGLGQVPWLTMFRVIPEVRQTSIMENGDIGVAGQRIRSWINARNMEEHFARWVQSVNETRRRLREPTLIGFMAIQLQLRAMMQRVMHDLGQRMDAARNDLQEDDRVLLNKDRVQNLHLALVRAVIALVSVTVISPSNLTSSTSRCRLVSL